MKPRIPILPMVIVCGFLYLPGCGEGETDEDRGGLDQACYEDGTCDAPYVCEDGVCVEADEDRGDFGQACHEDGTCDAPYVCEGGVCVDAEGCPPGSGEHEDFPEGCHDVLEVPCDPTGVEAPENARLDIVPVTITWDDDEGWSDPEACEWSCEPGFGTHQEHLDRCLDELEVPCDSSAGAPENAEMEVVPVTVTWDDDEGWSDPEACEWSCKPGFAGHPSDPGSCRDSLEVACVDDPPVNADSTAETVIVQWIEADEEWSSDRCPWRCWETFGEHEDFPEGCYDTLDVPCDPAGVEPPENGHVFEDLVTITWEGQEAWSDPEACDWSCNPGFGEHETRPGECLDSIEVDCTDETPGNALKLADTVVIDWNDGAWTSDVCPWECEETFGEHPSDPGNCHDSLEVACVDDPPQNADSTAETVIVHWIEPDQQWSSDRCPWRCWETFGEHEDFPEGCYDTLDVPCDPAGVEPPENGHVSEDLVTITWDDQEEWSDPEACGWRCNPGFGEHETRPEECLDSVEVPCDDTGLEPPENGSIADTVVLTWNEEEQRWPDDTTCPLVCDVCYRLEGGECVSYLVFPGRTWPGNPYGLEIEVLGSGFDADSTFIWSSGEDQEVLVPSLYEAERLVVALPEGQFDLLPAGEVPLALDLGDTVCALEPFVLGAIPPGTGQTGCYSDSSWLTCPSEGSAFFGQDAQYGWDLFIEPEDRFEKYENPGHEGQPIVFDHFTRREWKGCNVGRSGSECASGSPKQDDIFGPRIDCQNSTWGGYSDWAVPTVREMSSLIDSGRSVWASTYASFFPNTAHGHHWTNTVYLGLQGSLFTVSFNPGYVWRLHGLQASLPYRCVRRPEEDRPGSLHRAETVDDEPVVRDTGSGLMWQGCTAGQRGWDCETGEALAVTWEDALHLCATLDWGGYQDWRLPDRNELHSMVDFELFSPAVDPDVFPATTGLLWSSTTYPGDSGKAWLVSHGTGFVQGWEKDGDYRVRCVRGGGFPLE